MIQFRKAKEEDLETIREIAFATWPTAYNAIIGPEQVAYMLEKMYNKGELLRQMLEGCIFLVAEQGAQAIGFAAFDNVEPEQSVYKLHKLYVLPEMHGKGVGKLMMNEVVSQVKRLGGKTLLLNVNKKNKARTFYERSGFTTLTSVVIDIGNGYVMDDFVMELKLQ